MNCTCQPQNVIRTHDHQFLSFVTTHNLHLANKSFLSIRNVSQAPRRTLESGLPSACSDRKTREAWLCRRSDPNRYKKFGCGILF